MLIIISHYVQSYSGDVFLISLGGKSLQFSCGFCAVHSAYVKLYGPLVSYCHVSYVVFVGY